MYAGIGVVLLRPAPSNNTDIRGDGWVLGLIALVFDDVRPSRKQLRYMLCAVLTTVHARSGGLSVWEGEQRRSAEHHDERSIRTRATIKGWGGV